MSETFALVSCAGRVLEPWCSLKWRAAPPAGEESRALLEECSDWCGWTARMNIVREMWMCEIFIVFMTIKNNSIMIHVVLGLLSFRKTNSWQVPECVTSEFCAGRDLQLVEDWRMEATASGGRWLHLQYQEKSSCRSTWRSFPMMKALQQLTS